MGNCRMEERGVGLLRVAADLLLAGLGARLQRGGLLIVAGEEQGVRILVSCWICRACWSEVARPWPAVAMAARQGKGRLLVGADQGRRRLDGGAANGERLV